MYRYVIYRCPEKCDCHQKLKEHEMAPSIRGESMQNRRTLKNDEK